MKWIFTTSLFSVLLCNSAFGWEAPLTVSPANQTLLPTSVLLNWNAVLSSSLYELELDTTSDFNSIVKQSIQKNYLGSANNLSDTQHQFSNLYFGQTYYWRIRARQGSDISAWSTVLSLRTLGIVPIQTPANAQLNLNQATVTIDWYAHQGASRYQVQIDTTNLFNSTSLVNLNKTYIDTSSNGADTRHVISNPLVNRVYFWRVRAINAIDTSAWHLRWFSTGTANVFVPNIPQPILPLQGLIEQATTQTFLWRSSNYANLYELYLDTIPQLNNPLIFTQSDTTVTVANLLPNRTYYWYVRAFNTGTIVSSWSTLRSFKTITFIAQPNLTIPQPNALDVDLNAIFRWNSVPYATHYRFTLSQNAELLDSISFETENNQIFIDTLLRRQTYFWSVQAFKDTAFSSVPSVTRSFTMAALPTPQLLLPLHQAELINNETEFSWSNVSEAQSYELRLSYGEDITHSFTHGASDSFWEEDSLFWGALYTWNVRAVSDSGNSAWTADRNFLVISPVGLSQLQNNEIVQVWPNPASTHFIINTSEKMSSLSLLRSDGSLIRKLGMNELTDKNQISIQDLSVGVYFIRIQTLDGKVLNKKLLKL
jgi:hypothetical protein